MTPSEWRDEQITKILNMKPSDLELANRFTYHAPKPAQIERYSCIRKEALYFAQLLCANCPDSRELSIALTKLEEVTYHANASIARETL